MSLPSELLSQIFEKLPINELYKNKAIYSRYIYPITNSILYVYVINNIIYFPYDYRIFKFLKPVFDIRPCPFTLYHRRSIGIKFTISLDYKTNTIDISSISHKESQDIINLRQLNIFLDELGLIICHNEEEDIYNYKIEMEKLSTYEEKQKYIDNLKLDKVQVAKLWGCFFGICSEYHKEPRIYIGINKFFESFFSLPNMYRDILKNIPFIKGTYENFFLEKISFHPSSEIVGTIRFNDLYQKCNNSKYPLMNMTKLVLYLGCKYEHYITFGTKYKDGIAHGSSYIVFSYGKSYSFIYTYGKIEGLYI